MYRQMREAAQSMRRGGIDLPSAHWTPPWEYVPDQNPPPDNNTRLGYVSGIPRVGTQPEKSYSGDGRRLLPVAAD
eukprot:9430549-Pyramimonas_sp.AAC.2